MKNIFIMPTKQYSGLYVHNNKYFTGDFGYGKNRNIYITSDQDIKENDHIITQDGRLVQVSYLLSKDLEGASKVVLTNDKNLKSDGVSPITSEFLEWFVKNRNIEEIEIDPLLSNNGRALFGYNITIPKEEIKQESPKVGIDWSNFPQSTKDAVGYIDPKEVMYSYEEVISMVEKYEVHLGSVPVGDMLTFRKWFEQFKK